ncbi:MAG: LytR/AlgR family response regulator transcription factor [Lepagella sp.]
MKYAIIENEEFALINLREVIKSVRPDYVCVFTAETVEDCVDYFRRNPDVQLIFMDIELDDGNSFEIFRQVDIKKPIIFTTAYNEYAIQAFKVNSIDYLLKPVSEEDVERAIKKYETIHSASVLPDYQEIANRLAPKPLRRRILISDKNGYSFVTTDEIAWFEAEDKYVSIVLNTGKRLFTDFASLSDVIEVLDPDRFFHISRNVVASIDSIAKISKFFKGRLQVDIIASDETRTELVSAARRGDFLEWLGHTKKSKL